MSEFSGPSELTEIAAQVSPSHTALLVIDMQNDFCAEGSEGLEIMKRNVKLMTLLKVSKPEHMTVIARRNLSLFRELCEEFAFHNLLMNFDQYIDIVKGNKSWVEI